MLVSILAVAKDNPDLKPEEAFINPDCISDVTIAGHNTTIRMASGTEYDIRNSAWLSQASESSPVINQICEKMKEIEASQSTDEWADDMYEKSRQFIYDYPDHHFL